MKTTGQWAWKSLSAKKCVITYQSNLPALKMDDTQAIYLYSAVGSNVRIRLVGGCVVYEKGYVRENDWNRQ